MLYTWPSQGAATGYLRDDEMAVWTGSHLRSLIVRLRNRFPSVQFHVLADGLGCRAVLSAFLTLTPEKQNLLQLILARPDVEVAEFIEKASHLSMIAGRVTLYVSNRDKSLDLSTRLHGSPRAGSSVHIIPGVDTIDVSGEDTGLINAGVTWEMLSDIHYVLRGIPPEQR